MEKKADLHIHSTYSDGIFTPEYIIQKAKALGLAGISFTDHDTVNGFLAAQDLCKSNNLDLISGIELSCHYNGREYHILAYNFDPEDNGMKQIIANSTANRLIRAEKIIEKLNNNKISISMDDVYEFAGKAPLARPHIASAMVKKGFVESSKEAFLYHIGDGRYAYHEKLNFPVEEGIKIINKSGGVSVLAHPAKTIDQTTLITFVKYGLDGVEVVHPLHNKHLQSKYHRFAAQYSLLETGGSDFHGNRDYDEGNFGKFVISYTAFDKIKRRCLKKSL